MKSQAMAVTMLSLRVWMCTYVGNRANLTSFFEGYGAKYCEIIFKQRNDVRGEDTDV